MNARLALYVTGAAYLSRTIYLPGGRRVAVLDRTKRWKMAARAMRAAGLRDYIISAGLRRQRSTLDRVLAFEWRF
ncbi:MAG: hypothetical protein BGO05_05315 [Rhizobiales bacterium 63-7]|nr:hypothetical protein [Hyphomicrobiales bacterium]OJU66623.1 MAG: hypothetical protein BGO05_05315 [Rhizobiales bacterium 63-7]